MADEPNIEETPVPEAADEAVASEAAPVAEKPKRASRAKAAPKAAAEEAAEPVADAVAEPEVAPEPEAEVAADAEPEVVAEPEAEVAVEAEPEAAPAAKAAPKSKAKAKADEAPAEPKRRGPRPKPLKAAVAKEKKERGTYSRDPKPIRVQAPRKERRGIVVSSKPDKTITVRVDSAKPHPKYLKIVRRSIRLHVHDERNEANVGDVVRVIETRPLSKLKRWRLTEILERAK
jgi:small subunit ribosomal protein S17